MRTIITLICVLLLALGINANGIVGVRVAENGDGKVTFDTAGKVDDYFNYTNYEEGKTGEEIGTIFIMGNSGESDDILIRFDLTETEIVRR